MQTLDMIKYLLGEIEEEKKYNEEYEKAKEEAKKEAEILGKYWWHCMEDKYQCRSPRQSIIKGNAKKIRQLLLKFY